MDVVYVVRTGDRNAELLYSLRSLSNVEHDRVWTAGHTPRWANTSPIPVNQVGSKYTKVLRNIAAIANHPDVSERFIFFNDDFYVMRPTTIPAIHRGEFVSHIETMRGGYRSTALLTLSLLNRWADPPYFSYTSHCPVIFEKDKVSELLARLRSVNVSTVLFRTLYGNVFQQGGCQMPDFKVSSPTIESYRSVMGRHDGNPLFLSSEDHAFHYGHLGRIIAEAFPQPSPYEYPKMSKPIAELTRKPSTLLR